VRTWARRGDSVALRVLSGCLGLCNGRAEGLDLVEDAGGEGGVGAPCGGDKLLPDERLETEIETGRVREMRELGRVEEVAEAIDEMAAALVELDDGGLDRVYGAHVGAVGHDGVEDAGDVLFGAFEVLCEEYGLVGKVGVDGEGPAVDGDPSCTGVSEGRGGERGRTGLELALVVVGGLADVPEVAETGLVEDEVVKEVLLGVGARGEGRCEGGPERGDGLHGEQAKKGFPNVDTAPLAQSHDRMDAISYRQYTGEADLPHIMSLVQTELSEPYVIYTYRYFLHQWCVPRPCSHPRSPAPGHSSPSSCVPRPPARPRSPPPGHPVRLVRPDRRHRLQTEHAQARLKQRLHRHAQRQQELAQTRRR